MMKNSETIAARAAKPAGLRRNANRSPTFGTRSEASPSTFSGFTCQGSRVVRLSPWKT